jgi:hypothetical protein
MIFGVEIEEKTKSLRKQHRNPCSRRPQSNNLCGKYTNDPNQSPRSKPSRQIAQTQYKTMIFGVEIEEKTKSLRKQHRNPCSRRYHTNDSFGKYTHDRNHEHLPLTKIMSRYALKNSRHKFGQVSTLSRCVVICEFLSSRGCITAKVQHT